MEEYIDDDVRLVATGSREKGTTLFFGDFPDPTTREEAEAYEKQFRVPSGIAQVIANPTQECPGNGCKPCWTNTMATIKGHDGKDRCMFCTTDTQQYKKNIASNTPYSQACGHANIHKIDEDTEIRCQGERCKHKPMKPKIDLKYSQWLCHGCWNVDEYKEPAIAEEKGMRMKKLKFHVEATKHFQASGCYVKVSDLKEQLHMEEMPVLFETAWTDFPIPAHQVLADLQTFFPDKNFDTLNAKMAYLQVDRHAATLTEKITEQALKSLAKDTISTKMSEIYLQEKVAKQKMM